MRIAFCGTGLLGSALVTRLLRAGCAVRVWNRSPRKMEPLIALGAEVAATPAAAASSADAVCLCLLDAQAVESVVFGTAGIAANHDARLVIDHSSIAPHLTRKLAHQLKDATGADWVDAPVSGGVAGALAGTLTVMAGGSLAAVDKAAPVMRTYAARITRIGELGAGQTAKLCNQTIVVTTLVAIAEAVSLARNSGIDPQTLTEALQGGWADSTLFRLFVPRMICPPQQMLGTLNTLLKDAETVADAARQTRTPIPVTGAAQQVLRLASTLGLGDADLSQVARLLESRDAF